MCLTVTCADPTSPGVWWRDDADWKQYDAAQEAAIQTAVAAGALRVELGNVVTSKYGGGARYVIDLVTMKQKNLVSGFERDVKIVKPAAPTGTRTAALDDTVMKELEACKKTILSLKKFVLKLNVDVLALKLQLAKSKAKQIGAEHKAIIAREPPSAPGPASSKCATRDLTCEVINCKVAKLLDCIGRQAVRCDMRKDLLAQEQSRIDEFEHDLLSSDDNLPYSDDGLPYSGVNLSYWEADSDNDSDDDGRYTPEYL